MAGYLNREKVRVMALGDKTSPYYNGLVAMLRVATADEQLVKSVKVPVVVPFSISHEVKERVENMFGVTVEVKYFGNRTVFPSSVAAVVVVLEAKLWDIVSNDGRRVCLIDGDLAMVVSRRLSRAVVERTSATPRMQAAYALEDDQVRRMAASLHGLSRTFAASVLTQIASAGGENYSGKVRTRSGCVEAVVFNHLKTPVGPEQVAAVCAAKRATGFGAFPFQPEMLWSDEGSLEMFPGMYYVDRVADSITFVPEQDPTMSFSHPYAALMGFVQNNSVWAQGVEYLCEKFLSDRGIFYYTMKAVDADFEMDEVLTTNFFCPELLDVVEVSYPAVRFSPGGVPVGWDRGVVRMPAARFHKAMYRCSTSASAIVRPVEVYQALKDYNNVLVNTVDSAWLPERMSEEAEERASLAIALLVNWRRHCMVGSLNVLLEAIRLRFDVANESLWRLSFMAMAAWWNWDPIRVVGEVTEDALPVMKVVDWCGNDFSVAVGEVDPWVSVEQVVGLGSAVSRGTRFYPWLPGKPVVPARSFESLLARARKAVGVPEPGEAVVVAARTRKGFLPVSGGKAASTVSSSDGGSDVTVASVVSGETVAVERVMAVLEGNRAAMRDKMIADSGAVDFVAPAQEVMLYDVVCTEDFPVVPVVEVDPVTAIGCDMQELMGGDVDRNVDSTGYRLAEMEVSKFTRGNMEINDSKRLIPKERWVRRARVPALGVEKRVMSQAALMGAAYKRNIGVPCNRGEIDLFEVPTKVVDRVIEVCFKGNWREILEGHLDTGLWQSNVGDIEDYVPRLETSKMNKMLDEVFSRSDVDLTEWQLMAKAKMKAQMDVNAPFKVDHPQTIMYLASGNANAMFSAMMRRFKVVFDEMLLPGIKMNAQESTEEHELWYNSMEARRRACMRTWSYAVDIHCYDRSQEHPALRFELEFYKRCGLDQQTLDLWAKTHGVKRATSMMFGVVLFLTLGGVSGIWKTLFRNGLINLGALVYSTGVRRHELVVLDIKGDDSEMETSVPLDVGRAVTGMNLTFNLSSKFFTADVRYMCKEFRIRKFGKWFFIADPWAKVLAVCGSIVLDGMDDSVMSERWKSLVDDLRHYDNDLLLEEGAKAAAQYYQLGFVPVGFARGLAAMKASRDKYFSFYYPPERVD